jgi:hypothetical protein
MILPSAVVETEVPRLSIAALSVAYKVDCWVQALPEREKTKTAPCFNELSVSSGAPRTARLPLAEIETEAPSSSLPVIPDLRSLACWLQVFPERRNT